VSVFFVSVAVCLLIACAVVDVVLHFVLLWYCYCCVSYSCCCCCCGCWAIVVVVVVIICCYCCCYEWLSHYCTLLLGNTLVVL
jgi:hypothetical protein